jgi:hypothetical protein
MLLTERKRQERRASVQQKVADAITAFAGSMPFVYVNRLNIPGLLAVKVGDGTTHAQVQGRQSCRIAPMSRPGIGSNLGGRFPRSNAPATGM